MIDLGPWEVFGPERGYSSRPFWKLVRKNRAWRYGQDFLMTPKSRDARRFYSEDRASACAMKLNAAVDETPPSPVIQEPQ